MVSSFAARGIVLAGLLMAALGTGCARFGGAVIGGDGAAPDVATVDAATLDAALDVALLDAADVPRPDAVAFDAPDVRAPDVAPVDATPGDATPGCRQNDDCADPRQPVCDAATGRCVGCLASPDTCPLRHFCEATTQACQDGCVSDADCAIAGAVDAGSLTRRCDLVRHTCGDCLADADCPSGATCVGGACATGCGAGRPCAAGLTCCASACVDLATSSVHCGVCGARCDLAHGNPVCVAGACAVGTCTGVFGDCDGVAANGCETPLRTTSNCGACGRPCPVPPNAAPTCTATGGGCGFTCHDGYADCDGRADNGCEVELARSVDHCGACGQTCAPAHAVGSCAAGVCGVGSCAAGYANCDGVAANGCESDMRGDATHCGSCATACPSGAGSTTTCASGVCMVTCNPGLADCNGVAADGCEADTRASAANCGACGTVCAPAHAVGACRAGACAVASCAPGYADCNGSTADGCEVDLSGNGGHCGACATACASGQVCALGLCRSLCMTGQTACGTSCADLTADAGNCGACGHRCASGQVCTAGACQLDCASLGETLCAGACVRINSDPFNCGRCGGLCASGAGATAVCVAGACGVVCATGLGDCDGSAATGCESTLATDLRNCGACGRACVTANASASCAGGRCAIARCDAGYGDCDGDPGDGCETALSADARNCGACGLVCGDGTVCTAGACVTPPGRTLVSGSTVINTARASVNGAAGSTTLRLGSGVGSFAVGAEVLVHQTQSRAGDAGRYELHRVAALGSGTVTLDAALTRGYTTDASVGAQAQVVLVQQYTDLYITPSGVLSAPAWNGLHGGILAVDVAGDATVEGQVSMDGRGFRGTTHACAAGLDRCTPGVSGETATGGGAAGRAANGGGGGGGGAGADCGAGGGGAYGAVGSTGADGDCNGESGGGLCAMGCPNPGGSGGGAYGNANLGTEVQLGSAGGEGGGDEDGETPGGGGNGGGVIWLRAGRAVTVTGTITAGGSAGLDGNQSACGIGSGCGMGGGGGGSGGAVRIAAATSATVGTGLVRAAGGGGGVCSCGRIDRPERSFPGGRGGVGRVGVAAATVSGTTTPTYDPR